MRNSLSVIAVFFILFIGTVVVVNAYEWDRIEKETLEIEEGESESTPTPFLNNERDIKDEWSVIRENYSEENELETTALKDEAETSWGEPFKSVDGKTEEMDAQERTDESIGYEMQRPIVLQPFEKSTSVEEASSDIVRDTKEVVSSVSAAEENEELSRRDTAAAEMEEKLPVVSVADSVSEKKSFFRGWGKQAPQEEDTKRKKKSVALQDTHQQKKKDAATKDSSVIFVQGCPTCKKHFVNRSLIFCPRDGTPLQKIKKE
ncbi:MAG: hypothetical protein KKH94_10340 [Candidatus Omnitrophica bacterium]|nr:hypothetical protein [Candidatus Omnitrophota bacterium]